MLQDGAERATTSNARDFIVQWGATLAKWQADWPHIGTLSYLSPRRLRQALADTFLKIRYQHVRGLTHAVSLRLAGDPRTALAECCAAAMRTMQIVAAWQTDDAHFASNSTVTNIACVPL